MSKYLVPLLLFLIILFCFTTSCLCDNVGDECPQMDRECLLKHYENLILPRRDPGEVGKITSLTLENGEVRKMKTLSIKPPIFEIPNYLTEAECDDIIEIAKNQGLETSVTFNEETIEEIPENKVDDHDLFVYYDYNNDEHLDVKEVFNLLDTEMDFSPDREDIIDMFEKLQLDENSDLLISMEEFRKRNLQNIFQYVSEIKERKPYTKSRNSNQTWLDTDDDSVKTLQSLRLRLLKLTQLPMVLLNTSESLQVVKYDPKGHYNCHLDSDDISDEAPCCHVRDVENCRICRYLTVLYFLNDVEEGGETAFPIADNITYDDEVWSKDVKRICNVGRNCHESNIRVKPEKGKAIMWYSHVIDEDTHWLGETDPFSVHGGCDVKKGTKWIANNWISLSENRSDDIKKWIDHLQNSFDGKITLSSRDEGDNKRLDKLDAENREKEEGIDAIFKIIERKDTSNIDTKNEL